MPRIDLADLAEQSFGTSLEQLDDRRIYKLLVKLVQERSAACPLNNGKKKLYYISAEFLIGKLLINNMIDLGIYAEVKDQLTAAGHDLNKIEEFEVEPSLGNGGLGRLAACFLDSIATLGLTGDGVGLNYHYGLFRQRFSDNQQKAVPDEWLGEQDILIDDDRSYTVEFGDFAVTSKLVNIDVPGYGQPAKNRLRLFDLVGVDDGLVPAGSIDFDKTALAKNLTLFLYPDDSDADGRLLRIYQIHVDITCIFQGCLYRTFSDLVKADPVYFLSFQLKCFHQVPGNCFSFAVRVSCKINLICFFYFFSKSCKDLTFSSDCNVFRLKVMLQVYSHLTFRQISYMSV